VIQGSTLADIRLARGYGSAAPSTLSHTLFGSPARIDWGDGVIRSLAEFQNAFGKCAGCREGDARFANAVEGDFSLSEGSPAQNAGVEHEVYELFRQRYGLDIRVDKDRVVRPAQGAWDLGAYERP